MLNSLTGAFRTASPILSTAAEALEQCRQTSQAVAILKRAKPHLCDRLHKRFASPLAEVLTLKALNLLLARYHFRARSASLLSRPFGLIVDPSNMCQLACPGCVHSVQSEALQLFDWPKGTLHESRFSALLKRYGPHAIGVHFYNYGEPLLNLNTPQLIRLAKAWLLRTTISSTLSVRRFDAEAYVQSGLDYMALSIDGATQPVYERFRRNGDLELVFANLRKLVEAKRQLGRRYPVLAWNFLAFKHNVHEIPVAAEMARKLGVDLFRVVQPFDVSWDDPTLRPANITPEVHQFHRNSATNWNPFPDSIDSRAILDAYENPWSELLADDSAPTTGHTCHWLYKNIVMDAPGRIMPCCGSPRPDINLVFGTFDGNGADPFDSGGFRYARAWFTGHAPPESATAPHCTQCEWDQTAVNIGSEDIRNYFQSASGAFFDRDSLRILSDW